MQHPGTSTGQAAINSVGIHLIALCLHFEKNLPVSQIIRTMGELSKGRLFQVHWLAPPEDPYPVTVVDLLDATSPEDYSARVLRWAETTWDVWGAHHDQVREWAELTSLYTSPSPPRVVATTEHGEWGSPSARIPFDQAGEQRVE